MGSTRETEVALTVQLSEASEGRESDPSHNGYLPFLTKPIPAQGTSLVTTRRQHIWRKFSDHPKNLVTENLEQ
jgi:hypothetical protein